MKKTKMDKEMREVNKKMLEAEKFADEFEIEALLNEARYHRNVSCKDKKARKIDKKRTENFIKNVWIWDMNNVKPASSGLFRSFKTLMRFRSQETKVKSLTNNEHEGENREKADMAPVVEWVCQNAELTNHLNPLREKYFPEKFDTRNINCAMLLDAFIFDYKIPRYGKTPFELYIERAKLYSDETEGYEEFLDNIFSAFEILDVEINKGMRLYDIINNKTYYIKEKKGTYGATIGDMIVCRIAKVGNSFRILGPGAFNWPPEIAYSLKRLYNERKLTDKKISPFDILDIVLKIENKGDKPMMLDEIKKSFIWNSYPRKEFNGKAPQDVEKMGPKEMMLIQSLLSEGASKITPDNYPSPKDAIKAMEKFKEKWLNTPQKELDGKTPMKVILEERERLDNPRKDISIQIQLKKVGDFDANKAEKLYFDALAHHKKGRFEQSIKLLKEVVEMYPENYKAWGNMGVSYLGLEEYGESIKCLKKSLSLKPRYKIAKRNLKYVENLVNRYDEISDLKKSTDEKKLLEMAVNSEKEKNYIKALAYVKKILLLYPKSYHALFLKYRVTKEIGEASIADLKLAFEEAKKQNAGKEVLELMEDELNDMCKADEEIDIKQFDKLIEGYKKFDKNYQKKDYVLSKPIKDYGKPAVTQDFFESNPMEVFSAASIGYNILLNPKIEKKSMKIVYSSLPSSRKRSVDKEKQRIKEAKNAEELLKIIKQKIDPLNENTLIENIHRFENKVMPRFIEILKDNTNDFLADFSVKLIYNCKTDHSVQILDALHSIKDPYTLSMVCLALGLVGNKQSLKPLWDCYHFLKEEYPNESLDQGPLLALSLLNESS